jgi:hypothetical protein
VPLIEWHRRLGAPEADVRERTDAEGRPTGQFDAEVFAPAPQECALGPGVLDAFYDYDAALRSLAGAQKLEDLDGSYLRFPIKALRVAVLLGSLDSHSGIIELKHWARGQAAAEDWRAGLHAVYEQVNAAAGDENRRNLEERLLELVARLGSLTAAHARRYLPRASTGELAALLNELLISGLLRAEPTYYGTLRYLPVEMEGESVDQ